MLSNQIPSHTHSRGSQNITGTFSTRNSVNQMTTEIYPGTMTAGGSFKKETHTWETALSFTDTRSSNGVTVISFDASRDWTGEIIVNIMSN